VVAALALTALIAVPAPPARAAEATCPGASARVAQAGPAEQERAIRCLVNRERDRRDLPRLRADERLASAAAGHSRDMVRRGFFDHTSPGGSTPARRARRAGYPWRSIGETIAWGSGPYATAASTVERWIDSPGHREILLHPGLREIGVGVAVGAPVAGQRGGATATALLGRR
jgi:uncharacterized protein YkwD